MTWRKYKLGEVLKRKKEIVDILPNHRYKLLTIKLYHKGVTLRNIANGSEIKSTMSLVKEGDFVLSGIDARNGAFGIVPKELDGAIVTNDFWCLDPDENVIDKEFLLFLTSTQFFDYICKQSSDGTTQRIRLQREKFFNHEINLPLPSEQKKLVSRLNTLKLSGETLSSELTYQLSLVKQLRQAFLREAMQGKLVPQDPSDEPARELLKKIKAEKEQLIKDKKIKKEKELPPIKPEEIPFKIPKSWGWCRLGEVIEYTENLNIQKQLSPTSEINYVDIDAIDNQRHSIREVKVKRVQDLSSRARRVLKKGYILYSTVRPYLENIAIVDRELENFIGSTGFNVFKTDIDTKFVFNFLLSPDLNEKFKRMMVGFNSPSITNDQFENSIIPIPPLSEQHRIVAKLEQLMNYCDGLEQSIKQGQTQNEQLLQQVMREALQPKNEYEMNNQFRLAAEP